MPSRSRTLRRLLVPLAVVAVVAGTGAGAGGAPAGSPRLPDAEIFATNNRATITDPADPRLKDTLWVFERRVKAYIRADGGVAGRSRLLEGTFYDDVLDATTFERSREFDVDSVTRNELHRIADRVRRHYHQRSVLTFDYAERKADPRDAVEVILEGVDVQRFRAGLLADEEVREKLVGGSRTTDGRLILIAERGDLALVKRFVTAIGGDFGAATIRRGHREFVD
jgi:hypothetical protein